MEVTDQTTREDVYRCLEAVGRLETLNDKAYADDCFERLTAKPVDGFVPYVPEVSICGERMTFSPARRGVRR